MTTYVAKDGTPLTDQLIEGWDREADRGFPHSALVREDDPFFVRQPGMRAHTIRIPDAVWTLVKQKAKEQNMTVSEYTRKALAAQLAH